MKVGTVRLVDSHCHLDFQQYDQDRDEVIERASNAGVIRIVVPAVDLANSERVLRLAERYEAVYAAVGVHPNSAADWHDSWLLRLSELAQHMKVVAIGEIGLDYYREWSSPAIQRKAFSAQLELAADLGLPVVVHNREAGRDVLRLLDECALKMQPRKGVLHSFSGDQTVVQQALTMGYYLGFTGPVTFKKANDLRNIAASVPKDRLLVETDGPYLTPEPYRGRRNEPAYVKYVAEQLASIHNLPIAEFAEQTTDNAVRLFDFDTSANSTAGDLD